MERLSADDAAEVVEPFLDEASRELFEKFAGEAMPELLGEIPLVKSVLIASKIFNTAKAYHRTRMMISFLAGLQNGEKDIQEFENLSEEDKSYVRSIVVSQLDLQSDERQSEAIGLITDAYLKRKIDRLKFVGVVSEIKNTNPLLYYFSVDSLNVTFTAHGSAEVTGPTELLPAAFGHNTVTDIGMLGSTGRGIYVLSQLGRKFFEHVYRPMSDKYQI